MPGVHTKRDSITREKKRLRIDDYLSPDNKTIDDDDLEQLFEQYRKALISHYEVEVGRRYPRKYSRDMSLGERIYQLITHIVNRSEIKKANKAHHPTTTRR